MAVSLVCIRNQNCARATRKDTKVGPPRISIVSRALYARTGCSIEFGS
jgi:hypothetical protein